MQNLEPLVSSTVVGREFILTLNGQQVMVPVPQQERFEDEEDGFHHCPWFDGLTGFENACESCKVSFG